MTWFPSHSSVNYKNSNANNNANNRSNYNNMTLNIRDINNTSENVKIRGLVIAKSPLRLIRVNNNNNEYNQNSFILKAVFNFTLRDSVTDFVNVTSWGKAEYSTKLYGSFHMGDVVSVSNLSCEKKKVDNREYSVETSCEYGLVMRERESKVEAYYGGDRGYMVALQSTLLHPMSDHVSLLDMILFLEASGGSIAACGQHFTFLALVARVGDVQQLLSKTQREEGGRPKLLHKMDVVLMDESCRAFPLTVWDGEWIDYVKINWIAGVTVVSLVDCKVKYDEYKRGMVGVIDCRTISIQNPDVIESHKLHNLINIQNAMGYEITANNNNKTNMDANIGDIFNRRRGDTICDEDMPLTSIQNVCTVKTIKSRSMDTEYGVLYGVLSNFNLDSDDLLQNFISLKCKNCKRRIMPKQPLCSTIDCPMLGENVSWTNKNAVEVDFNTIINICDHTGTLTKCSLSGQVMESFLRCTPYQLIELDQQVRAQMKWEMFLNRYKFYIKCSLPSFDNSSPFMKILGIQIPTVYEILASVKE